MFNEECLDNFSSVNRVEEDYSASFLTIEQGHLDGESVSIVNYSSKLDTFEFNR